MLIKCKVIKYKEIGSNQKLRLDVACKALEEAIKKNTIKRGE